MAIDAVVKSRILTGAGRLYRAPVGTLFPGQVSATVTNKAVATGVATLTTSTSHGYTTGDQLIVSIGDAQFDGLVTCTSGTATTSIKFAVSGADVTSAAATGSAVLYKTAAGATAGVGGTVSGSKFTDRWPAGWTPWGATREGSEFKWTPSTGNIEIAEELLPVQIITEGVESSIAFDVVQFTAYNFAAALNGGTVSTVSGTGATLLTEVEPPELGSESRIQIGWESADSTERAWFVQCFQGGDLGIAHKKGTDNAGLSVEYKLEQPAYGKAVRRFYAGSTPVGLA